MSLLFETIKIDNSLICNIDYHNERLNRSRMTLFNSEDSINLETLIEVPANFKTGIIRCRILYDQKIRKIEFHKYQPKIIKSLKLIECNDIDYSFKYNDRTKLNELLKQKGKADDILIIKNDRITDTSISNIVFYDDKKWITPASPLLYGTKRSHLLKENTITEDEIKISDLKYFRKAALINAMIDIKEGNFINMDNIG